MDWAVNNGYLTKGFDKGLKLSKDADSSREAVAVDFWAATVALDACRRIGRCSLACRDHV